MLNRKECSVMSTTDYAPTWQPGSVAMGRDKGNLAGINWEEPTDVAVTLDVLVNLQVRRQAR